MNTQHTNTNKPVENGQINETTALDCESIKKVPLENFKLIGNLQNCIFKNKVSQNIDEKSEDYKSTGCKNPLPLYMNKHKIPQSIDEQSEDYKSTGCKNPLSLYMNKHKVTLSIDEQSEDVKSQGCKNPLPFYMIKLSNLKEK